MAPGSSLVPFCSPLSLLCGPWPPATLDMLSITMVLFFLKFHINRLLLLSVLRVIMLLGMSVVCSFISKCVSVVHTDHTLFSDGGWTFGLVPVWGY